MPLAAHVAKCDIADCTNPNIALATATFQEGFGVSPQWGE